MCCAVEQRHERGTRVSLPAPGRVDRIADLHHASQVRRPVVTGATDGHLTPTVEDGPGDPSYGCGVRIDLPAPPLPRAQPLWRHKVRRQRDRRSSVRCGEVAGG